MSLPQPELPASALSIPEELFLHQFRRQPCDTESTIGPTGKTQKVTSLKKRLAGSWNLLNKTLRSKSHHGSCLRELYTYDAECNGKTLP
jgi:hypothetical protein